MKRVLSLLAIITLALTGCSDRTTLNSNQQFLEVNQNNNVESSSNYKISLNNNKKMVLTVNNIVSNFEDYGLQLECESLENKKLYSVDNYDSTTYICYTNEEETKMYEILLTHSIPEEMDLYKMKNIESGADADDNLDKYIKAYEEPGYTAAMLTTDLGQVYIGIGGNGVEQSESISLLKETFNNLNKFDKNKDLNSDVQLLIEGLGELRLSSIECLSSNPGIYYGTTDNILRLYNADDDIPYVFISNIANPMLINTVSSLEETTWNNVYVDKEYDNPEDMGYRTFSIMSTNGMYTFRLNEKAPNGTGEMILKELNIKADDVKIELPFNIGENIR